MKRIFAVAGAGMLASMSVQAQGVGHDFPNRPITIVVPTAAGGTNSLIARLIAEKLQARIGQSIVVDNKAGANTAVGAQYVAKSKPDGYTLLLTGAATFTTNPTLYPNLGYKLKDFEYVAVTGKTPLVLITNPESGFKTVADVIAAAKKAPGTLAYASFGIGSSAHLAGETFANKAGISMIHTAYKGSTPGLTDLMGNQIQLSFDTLPAALPFIQAKKVIALAAATNTRIPQLPNVPTVESTGLGDYNFAAWIVLAAPRGTPQPILKRLEDEMKAVMANPDLQRSLETNGFEATYMNSESVSALMSRELEHNKAIIQQSNITLD